MNRPVSLVIEFLENLVGCVDFLGQASCVPIWIPGTRIDRRDTFHRGIHSNSSSFGTMDTTVIMAELVGNPIDHVIQRAGPVD